MAAAGVRRLAITRRSSIVSAYCSRRARALKLGRLNWTSSKTSRRLGSCRLIIRPPSGTCRPLCPHPWRVDAERGRHLADLCRAQPAGPLPGDDVEVLVARAGLRVVDA